ncbi:MAG: hypothetical protein NTW07_12230 [candidate division Zixibacteria bacterium]|nr:hypothetical protein [candidate division Zixibacteria bacterium]
MEEQSAGSESIRPPLTFLLVKWYGYILSMIFLLYGGVSIVLGILDRDYSKTGELLVFFVIGLVLVTLVIGLREHKLWGWYGQIGVHGLIIIIALFHPLNPYNWLLIVLSGGTIGLLMAPPTRAALS